jgi:hypothetical protein
VLGEWISFCAPGEFEKQAALMLGLSGLPAHVPRVTVDIVRALVDHIPLIAIVTCEDQRLEVVGLLSDWGVPAHLLHFVCMPVRSPWVRDYGPSFVRWTDGSVMILDAEYPVANRPHDDKMPTALAELL